MPATTNLADDHWASMDPKAHGETSLSRSHRPILQRFDHTKPGTNAALDLVFVGLWVAEICHQSIAQIMRNIPLKAVDDLRTWCALPAQPHVTLPHRGGLRDAPCLRTQHTAR